VEIAWRWFLLAFCVAVLAGLTLVAGEAVRLRPNEVLVLRSRNLVLIITVLLGVFRRYQVILENLLGVAAAAAALLWVVGGALVMARLTGRKFLVLAGLRVAALAVGSAALFSCLAVIAAVSSRQPQQTSLGLVSLFSLVVYGCWRWTSLLLGVLSYAPDLRRGWAGFVACGPDLALTAATNSTLKWLSMFAVTVAAAGGFVALPRNGSQWPAAALLVFWLLAVIAISGFFAAGLKNQLAAPAAETELELSAGSRTFPA
jgi:hypothetical protein